MLSFVLARIAARHTHEDGRVAGVPFTSSAVKEIQSQEEMGDNAHCGRSQDVDYPVKKKHEEGSTVPSRKKLYIHGYPPLSPRQQGVSL